MALGARFSHVNLVARDWQGLAAFYQQVLGCVPVAPERDVAGPALDAATGLRGAHIRGVHLRLPGGGEKGPTLEIFQYDQGPGKPPTAINRPGLGHLAFGVDDVHAAREALLAAGGGMVGEVVTVEIAGAGSVTFFYATDPEGNVIELQSWSR